MFDRIELTNFRRHESLAVDFTHGVIAIRGANEAGKTTLQEAMAYAMFGADALRQPFDECVTWGKAPKTLCVTLHFTLEGVAYKIVRKSSGAELTYGDQRVTGQKEVTRFVETLLGTTAKVATKMMLATQGGLRGALTEGPAAAVSLIQELADFDLIDRVIELVQTKLPNGNVTADTERLSLLNQQLGQPLPAEPDITQEEAEEQRLNTLLGDAYRAQSEQQTALQSLDVAEARNTLAEAAAVQRDHAAAVAEQNLAKGAVKPESKLPDVSKEDIAKLRDQQASLRELAADRNTFLRLMAIGQPEEVWEEGQQNFAEFLTKAREVAAACAKKVQELEFEIRTETAKLINDKTCGLCGKDLSDVPEVVQRNLATSAKLAELQTALEKARLVQVTDKAALGGLEAHETNARAYEAKIAPHSAYVTRTVGYPAGWVWAKGAVPEDAPQDLQAAIQAAELAWTAYERAKATREAALAALERADNRVTATLPPHDIEEQVRAARSILAVGEQHTARISELSAEIQRLQLDVKTLEGKVLAKFAAHKQLLVARAQLQAQLDQTQKSIGEKNENNVLLKKLRAAKPVVADKLWSIVLAAVSVYFSQVRGVPSVVTRSDNGFKVDGQSVGGLSGSTLDALGLAIRVALTKTFLPNAPFMMLDEPGAACDDERETNMLGLVATADFDQVILVTHSALADAFASQVVQL
jgi:hypothetical protein